METIELLKAPHQGIKLFKASMSKNVRKNDPVVVTVNGEPKGVLVPYASMVEMLQMIEEMRDGKLKAEIGNARAAYRESPKGVSARRVWEKYK